MYYKLILSVLTLFLLGCEKDNVVPNIRFDVTINLSDPKYAGKDVLSLVDVEDWASKARMRVGYAGVIVYKSNIFRAFEIYCPHDQQNSCNVSIKENETTTAVCNCCNTEFLAVTGEVMRGPSKYALKEYKTQYSVNNLLRIWN